MVQDRTLQINFYIIRELWKMNQEKSNIKGGVHEVLVYEEGNNKIKVDFRSRDRLQRILSLKVTKLYPKECRALQKLTSCEIEIFEGKKLLLCNVKKEDLDEFFSLREESTVLKKRKEIIKDSYVHIEDRKNIDKKLKAFEDYNEKIRKQIKTEIQSRKNSNLNYLNQFIILKQSQKNINLQNLEEQIKLLEFNQIMDSNANELKKHLNLLTTYIKKVSTAINYKEFTKDK